MDLEQKAKESLNALIADAHRRGREQAEREFAERLQKAFGGGFKISPADGGSVSFVDEPVEAKHVTMPRTSKKQKKEEKPKRKLSPAAYKAVVASLKKARAARMANLAKQGVKQKKGTKKVTKGRGKKKR